VAPEALKANAMLAVLLALMGASAAESMQLDVHFDCALAPPLTALAAAGFSATSTVKAGTLCVVEGWALPTALPRLAAVAGVTRVTPPSYVLPPRPHALRPTIHGQVRSPVEKQAATGAIDQNGITIMRAGQFVNQTGVNGAGVTVGVQSYGVYNLALIQGRGELPNSITVLNPAGNPTQVQADEGTVLLEEIHAVAPGATLMYCGPSTFVRSVQRGVADPVAEPHGPDAQRGGQQRWDLLGGQLRPGQRRDHDASAPVLSLRRRNPRCVCGELRQRQQ
jgi:hypothetical protein